MGGELLFLASTNKTADETRKLYQYESINFNEPNR